MPELALAPDLLQLAEHIVNSKIANFDPQAFRDRYEEKLLEHLKAKQVGAVGQEPTAFVAPHRVINLMDALRRSIEQDKKSPRKASASLPASRKT